MSKLFSSLNALKSYIIKLVKYGGVSLGLLIPLSLILNAFGFIRGNTVVILTECILFFGLGEVVFRMIMIVYRREKSENAKLKLLIKLQDIEALKKYSEIDKSLGEITTEELTKLVENIAKLFKKPKVETVKEISEEIETNIPEHQISVR